MDFLLPKLSATMETAKVLRWLKQVGDRVKMGEALVELETDKAAMEVESPVDATLDAVLADVGAELPVGSVLARLGTRGAAAGPAKQIEARIALPAAPVASAATLVRAETATQPPPRLLASPLAKRLAEIHAVDLGGLTGSGPHRRIRKRDVLAAVDARGAEKKPAPAAVVSTAAPAAPLPSGVEPLSTMRTQIARAVTLSRQTIPSFVLDRWVETTAIEQARALLGADIERATGIKPTFTDFLLQALADSLGAAPHLLDRWHEEGGRPARIRTSTVDIGLVVAVPDGVVIPVLRDLRGKTLAAMAQVRQAAVQRVRAGRLVAADQAPVSISLSNIGKGGADRFEAIINPGQSSILAVGRQHEQVTARGGAIAIAKGVNLTLSVDHRLIDGLTGAEFLEILADRIQFGPWTLG